MDRGNDACEGFDRVNSSFVVFSKLGGNCCLSIKPAEPVDLLKQRSLFKIYFESHYAARNMIYLTSGLSKNIETKLPIVRSILHQLNNQRLHKIHLFHRPENKSKRLLHQVNRRVRWGVIGQIHRLCPLRTCLNSQVAVQCIQGEEFVWNLD